MLNSLKTISGCFVIMLVVLSSCINPGKTKNTDTHKNSSTSIEKDLDYISEKGHELGDRSRSALHAIFRTAKEKDFKAFMNIASDPYIQHSPDMKDGWEPVWKLTTERPANFSSVQMKWLGKEGFLDNGNFLVMLREVDRADGTSPSKIIDLMRFDEDGKYAEHWDIRQALSENKKSGHPETGTSPKFLENPVNYSIEEEEKNKKRAVKYLNYAFNMGELPKALKEFADPDYVQHNPMIPDGTKPLIDAFNSGKLSNHTYDIKYVLAQNDLVVVYSRLTEKDKINAVIDIFRIRDGKMVEHWDVVQPVPADQDMPHNNGMF